MPGITRGSGARARRARAEDRQVPEVHHEPVPLAQPLDHRGGEVRVDALDALAAPAHDVEVHRLAGGRPGAAAAPVGAAQEGMSETAGPEDLRARLRGSGLRLTPQRELILRAVEELGHATPDEVYAEVRRHSSSINLSTVYRTLELLDELGLPWRELRSPAHQGAQGRHDA